MKRIVEIIKELQGTAGRLDKERILRENKDNELFKEVLKFVYDPYIVTGLSKKKLNKKLKFNSSEGFETIEDIISYLKTNNTGRDIDIKHIQNWLSYQEHKEILSQIATKELKTGITAKTINKALKEDLIREFNVMLAHSYFKDDNGEKLKGDFIVTTKLDGLRVVAIRDDDSVKFFSRQGQVIEGLEDITEEFLKLPTNKVYDGELLLRNDNNLASDDLYRETMKAARKDGVKKNLQFHMFDMLPLEDFQKGQCKNPCVDRKNQLHKILNDKEFHFIVEVPILCKGNDKNKIIELLNKAKANNQEGVMVNKTNGLYECKRSKAILKVKVFLDGDMKVINITKGDGRNKDKLGAITVEFEHEGNVYTCDVGSGFSDSERELYFNNQNLLLGKIVTIGYFEVSTNQQGGVGLRFPTWKGIIRNDKTEISMN